MLPVPRPSQYSRIIASHRVLEPRGNHWGVGDYSQPAGASKDPINEDTVSLTQPRTLPASPARIPRPPYPWSCAGLYQGEEQ